MSGERLFRALHALGSIVPGGFPHATAFGNRVLRPLFDAPANRRFRIRVWDGLLFDVDPADCIGGNLAFAPRAFEYPERRFLERHLPAGGTFVDVGANIGIFTLYAARRVGAGGKVVAIEPDPASRAQLMEHVRLNGFEAIVTPLALGVSSRSETLRVHSANPANRGATSLQENGEGAAVECVPLSEALRRAGCARIDVLKIDIEGRELDVLETFFADVRAGTAPAPDRMIVETAGGPAGADAGYTKRLEAIIEAAGYRLEQSGLNSFYSRR